MSEAGAAPPSADRPRWQTLSELALPLFILAWRLGWSDVELIWRDWASILSVFWIVVLLARGRKTQQAALLLVSVALLGIYLVRVVPQCYQTLRWSW